MDINDVRPAVREFALLMEKKLRENDHKGGWEACSQYHLAGRLVEEAGELIMKMASTDGIEAEAADVANFAMMIADNARRRRKIREAMLLGKQAQSSE